MDTVGYIKKYSLYIFSNIILLQPFQTAANGRSVQLRRYIRERGPVRRGHVRGVLHHVQGLQEAQQGAHIQDPEPRGLGRRGQATYTQGFGKLPVGVSAKQVATVVNDASCNAGQ